MKFLYVDEHGGRNQSAFFIKAGIKHHIHLFLPRHQGDEAQLVDGDRAEFAVDDDEASSISGASQARRRRRLT
ncbi:hypothetical protein JCM17845_10640 [Iodidimonas gelatinilytica]|uniref:Uncharacterized protein n=1 Tax=Iodidimonas gelatinilytica TaxID=1236966 RepID=A0A5A7MWI9_9PROT|nr:hypothetical protein [Iodidimonas gelatinilytica]GER00441.1 hypothetical protein JCM17845_10640 [Iodidimonas gelatinilytica]